MRIQKTYSIKVHSSHFVYNNLMAFVHFAKKDYKITLPKSEKKNYIILKFKKEMINDFVDTCIKFNLGFSDEKYSILFFYRKSDEISKIILRRLN